MPALFEIAAPLPLGLLSKGSHCCTGGQCPGHPFTGERFHIAGGITQQQKALTGERVRVAGEG